MILQITLFVIICVGVGLLYEYITAPTYDVNGNVISDPYHRVTKRQVR